MAVVEGCRLPVRFVFDNNYFNDAYQGIPIGGYNKLIDGLLKDCDTMVGVDFFDNSEDKPNVRNWREYADKLVFTAKIDEFYSYQYGKLDYRSLRFDHEEHDVPNYQGNAVVNYTDRETPWTRIIEHKWFEFGKDENGKELPKTVISREYSSEWKPGDEPYYPVNDEKNNGLYEQYRQMADREEKVCFGGRLGEYKYYDMDAVILSALTRAREML